MGGSTGPACGGADPAAGAWFEKRRRRALTMVRDTSALGLVCAMGLFRARCIER